MCYNDSMKIKNRKNGCVVVRIGMETITYFHRCDQNNVIPRVKEKVKMLVDDGIDFDYVVGYPRDGDPVVAVNSKYSDHWDEEGRFPELFEQEPETAKGTDKVAV